MSSNTRFGMVLEYVADVAAAKPFYTDILGLQVDREHPAFIQFKDEQGVAIAITSDEAMGDGAPELYWLVDDADAAYAELSGKAEVSLPLKEMPFGKVFALKDPAGQPQYLVEFAEERPSQQVT